MLLANDGNARWPASSPRCKTLFTKKRIALGVKSEDIREVGRTSSKPKENEEGGSVLATKVSSTGTLQTLVLMTIPGGVNHRDNSRKRAQEPPVSPQHGRSVLGITVEQKSSGTQI